MDTLRNWPLPPERSRAGDGGRGVPNDATSLQLGRGQDELNRIAVVRDDDDPSPNRSPCFPTAGCCRAEHSRAGGRGATQAAAAAEYQVGARQRESPRRRRWANNWLK